MLLSLALIFLFGMLFGELFGRMRLPKLTGMIAAGILLGSLSLLSEDLLEVSPQLRKIALIIILLRAGLGLKLSDLKKIGRPAVLMSFIPACFEIAGCILLAPPLLGLSMTEAAIIGSVLAAVSPAVIVPKMLALMERRCGTDKLIPQLILAGASVDDIFVIVLFSAFTSAEGGISPALLAEIPLSIALGAAAGILCGLLLAKLFEHVSLRDSAKVIIVLSTSFLLTALEDALGQYIGFSSLVAVITVGITLLNRAPQRAQRLSAKFNKLWVAAEIVLFVLVGAAVDVSAALNAGIGVLLLILGALVFRSAGVMLCLIKTKLNFRERLFCVFSYIPKATVQAAIGAIPLSMGMPCGQVVLSAAVTAILLTATLGAVLIDIFGKRWLSAEHAE